MYIYNTGISFTYGDLLAAAVAMITSIIIKLHGCVWHATFTCVRCASN